MRFLILSDEDCETALETLEMDSHSSAFDRDLRKKIEAVLFHGLVYTEKELEIVIGHALAMDEIDCTQEITEAIINYLLHLGD